MVSTRRDAAHRDDRVQVIFAPEERADTVLRIIGAAKKTLMLSLFRCDDFKVLDALAAALERDVKVEILVTRRAKGWKKKLDQLWHVLESMGAKLYRYADPVVKYHAKYIVADDGPALVASLNFTRQCFTNTADFLLTTHNPGVVTGLKKLFRLDCGTPGAVLPKRLSSELIVGPEHARERFATLISGARRSISIVDPKLTDPAMLGLIKSKKAAGLNVRVLGSRSVGGLVSHGKLILIDDEFAVIGSLALSALSLDFRREVAILVRDRPAVLRLVNLFQDLASRGSAPA
jgi:phosphatidylserine/phosphatidylglycerophosphate/cardiolipin synthase-like enzyme